VEIVGAVLATVVEDEAEVDGEVQVDAEDVGLDSGAEADGGLQVDEPIQQRAARLVRRRADLGLHQAQHVGAHAQLQRVPGAVVPAGRGRRRLWGRWRRAVGRARHCSKDQADSQDERRSCSHGDRADCTHVVAKLARAAAAAASVLYCCVGVRVCMANGIYRCEMERRHVVLELAPSGSFRLALIKCRWDFGREHAREPSD